VIDLLDGVVVHAIKGQRHHYQPIASQLTTSSKPLDIVKAFMDVYPFSTLYIADLNAIQSSPTDQHSFLSTIETILNSYAHLNIWLDAGFNHNAQLNTIKELKKVTPVLGSENLHQIEHLQAMTDTLDDNYCLSLDFMPQGYVGIEELLNSSKHWPNNVIAMTLQQVGSNAGPDIATLNQIFALANGHRIFAAGGIRNASDLSLLDTMGIHGALLATALHNQQVKTEDLTQFMQ